MIKNRKELMQLSSQWMEMASTDLRNHLISFMEEVGASEEELANVLCISVNELNDILNCSGNISLATFAKLLIATDNVIEIKPISTTPLKGFNGQKIPIMPMMGNKPKINKKSNIPPMFGEMPSMFEDFPIIGNTKHNIPQRDSRGRFIKNNDRSNQAQVNVPRKLLVSTIIENGWDNEIDMMSSTSDELMQFLMSKGLTSSHFMRMSQNQNDENKITSDEKEKIYKKISEALENNPHLMNEFKKYI